MSRVPRGPFPGAFAAVHREAGGFVSALFAARVSTTTEYLRGTSRGTWVRGNAYRLYQRFLGNPAVWSRISLSSRCVGPAPPRPESETSGSTDIRDLLHVF